MVLEGQDVLEPTVVVELGYRTPLPGTPEIEASAMLALTLTSAGVAHGTLQPMCISENV